MSVLDRDALEASPLADLHAIASELGLDGFRRLRKAELIDAILSGQDGEAAPRQEDDEPADEPAPEPTADREDDDAEERPRRGRRRSRGRSRPRGRDDADAPDAEDEAPAEEQRVEGTIELLGNGSAFLRVEPPEPSDADVYVSAAQVRRCELVSGDVVSGPARPPRRSERFSSLVRVETINGTAADDVAHGTPYDELTASFPTERLALGSDDPTVKAIEWLTPFGKGSRVTVVGAARAGKSEALRRIAGALAGQDGLEVTVVLAGVRPEEIAEWRSGPAPVAGAVHMGASADVQDQTVEQAVEQARRIAARGGHAVLVVDSLDGLHPISARRALAAARNLDEAGSLTVVASSTEPIGGETTVIALDAALTSTRRFPALDLVRGGTLRPELLVGEAGAEAIAKARAEASAEQ